jgi:hypothetical protein
MKGDFALTEPPFTFWWKWSFDAFKSLFGYCETENKLGMRRQMIDSADFEIAMPRF